MNQDGLHQNSDEFLEAAETHEDVQDVEEAGADPNMLATVATVGAIGVALVEAALPPGVLLGVAAVAAPKYMPRLGALTPIFRSTVRGVYKAA